MKTSTTTPSRMTSRTLALLLVLACAANASAARHLLQASSCFSSNYFDQAQSVTCNPGCGPQGSSCSSVCDVRCPSCASVNLCVGGSPAAAAPAPSPTTPAPSPAAANGGTCFLPYTDAWQTLAARLQSEASTEYFASILPSLESLLDTYTSPYTILIPSSDAFQAFLSSNDFSSASDIPADTAAKVLYGRRRGRRNKKKTEKEEKKTDSIPAHVLPGTDLYGPASPSSVSQGQTLPTALTNFALTASSSSSTGGAVSLTTPTGQSVTIDTSLLDIGENLATENGCFSPVSLLQIDAVINPLTSSSSSVSLPTYSSNPAAAIVGALPTPNVNTLPTGGNFPGYPGNLPNPGLPSSGVLPPIANPGTYIPNNPGLPGNLPNPGLPSSGVLPPIANPGTYVPNLRLPYGQFGGGNRGGGGGRQTSVAGQPGVCAGTNESCSSLSCCQPSGGGGVDCGRSGNQRLCTPPY